MDREKHAIHQENHEMHQDKQKQNKRYRTFLIMIGVSMVLMYFSTYLNSYQILDHAKFSESRLFMSLIMGAIMMVVMLGFMRNMYKNRTFNIAIIVGAIILFSAAVWLERSQITVDGVDYMEAMIPHHSIAILTSERSQIKDPRVRELADEIIKAQRKEIAEMEWLIDDIRTNGYALTQEEADQRPVPKFTGEE